MLKQINRIVKKYVKKRNDKMTIKIDAVPVHNQECIFREVFMPSVYRESVGFKFYSNLQRFWCCKSLVHEVYRFLLS